MVNGFRHLPLQLVPRSNKSEAAIAPYSPPDNRTAHIVGPQTGPFYSASPPPAVTGLRAWVAKKQRLISQTSGLSSSA